MRLNLVYSPVVTAAQDRAGAVGKINRDSHAAVWSSHARQRRRRTRLIAAQPAPESIGKRLGRPRSATVAYFSMEIALESAIPTYSGGLGVLAGDMLRAAADLAVPLVGVSLVHRTGYFRQTIEPDGRQVEHDARWSRKADWKKWNRASAFQSRAAMSNSARGATRSAA